MKTFIFLILLVLAATLMITGFIYEDGAKGGRKNGKLLIAIGFGVLAVAGIIVYGLDDARSGLFGVGLAILLSIIYLVRYVRSIGQKKQE